MKRQRWQLDILDDPAHDYESSAVTEETIRHKDKLGNLRPDDKGNLISSRVSDTHHMPVIDLDIAHMYVPSRTPGHGHLYLNVEVPNDRYLALIKLLRECRIIGEGNLNQMKVHGYTSTRLPFDYTKYPDLYDREL